MAVRNVLHVRDSDANDSDKVILTVPAGKVAEIQYMHVRLVSTATVGNRQLVALVRDGDDTLVADYHAGATQAASLTRDYAFHQGQYRETSFVDGSIQVSIPTNFMMLPGWDLRVYDSGAVDAAADDMTVDIVYTLSDHTDIHSV